MEIINVGVNPGDNSGDPLRDAFIKVNNNFNTDNNLANSGINGYLSGNDWDTFNGKITSRWTKTGSSIYYISGSVGIGTIPLNQLHVMGSTNSDYIVNIQNNDGNSSANGLKIQCSTNTGSTGTKFIEIFSNNGTSLGSIKWNGTSGVGASPAFGTVSDSRLKIDIVPTVDSINLLNQINVVDYKWIDKPNGKTYTGFIAQDLYTVYPNAIIKPEDDTVEYWSVMKEELIPLMVKSIQDLQSQINILLARIVVLETI